MTSAPNNDEDTAQSRAGALAALREVAQEADVVKDYPRVSAAFGPQDYEHIVALAWRNQFDDDRTRFKRDIRILQEQVGQRIMANLEGPE